jgi:hypothetical protein
MNSISFRSGTSQAKFDSFSQSSQLIAGQDYLEQLLRT